MVPYWQYAFYILHDLLALTCMSVVLSTARGFRERSRRRTYLIYAASGALAFLNIFFLNRVISATDFDTGFLIYGTVSLVSVLLFPLLILRASRYFTSALICLALNVGMEGLFSVIGYMLDGIGVYDYHFYETLFCSVGYALIAAFLLYASKNRDLKIIRSTVELIPKWLYVIIILCAFSSFFSIMGQDAELYSFERVTGIFRAISVLGVILFSGYFVFRVFSLMAKQNQILLQLSEQQRNYEKLVQGDEQLRKFRHDSKNHMLVVTALLGAGQTEEATEYLEQLNDISGFSEGRFLTGNLVVDAILNGKKAVAQRNEIALSFSGAIPEKGVGYADLCAVVGNLTDNAIEGAKACSGERYVKLNSAVRNGFLTISVMNPVGKQVTIRNNRIRTTKADPVNHGIGLKNVEAIAKQYHGQMLLSCSETVFTADVSLQLKE